MPSLADLLRNDPWGAPPQTPLAKTVTDVGFDPSLGFAGAVQTYLSRLKQMQGGLAQDMLDTAADPNAEGIQRAANLLGGLGLKVMNVPMALMPSAQELRDRGYQAGASPEMQAVGGALGDMVNIPEPASVGTLLAGLGKAAVGAKGLAGAAAMAGKSAAVAPLGKGLASLMADASPAEQAALKARLEAEAAQTGGQASSVSRKEALNGLTGSANVPSIDDLHAKLPRSPDGITYGPDGKPWWTKGSYENDQSRIRIDNAHITDKMDQLTESLKKALTKKDATQATKLRSMLNELRAKKDANQQRADFLLSWRRGEVEPLPPQGPVK